MKSKEVFDIVHQIETHQKELEAQVADGESQIAELNNAHAAEIARITQQHAAEIAKFKDDDGKLLWHGSKRSELEERILMLIAQNNAIETEIIRVSTGQGVEANQYRLDELRRGRFIKSSSGRNLETFWHLTHNGRGYLIQRGLLK
jgi:peptidoglycan hydrolase CwlO-like protein